MSKWWACIGLSLWIAGTSLAFGVTHQGVTSAPVRLRLADGTPIHGTLYRSSENPGPAAVVLHGTAVAHDSCAPGLSIPLARSGFTVLAIDMRGHGSSGGDVPRSEFRDLDLMHNSMTDLSEVDAAIDYLRSQPFVTGDRVALIGHSRGGRAAVIVGNRRLDVGCVVAVSSAPKLGDGIGHSDLLLVASGLDEIIPREQYDMAFADVVRTTRPVREEPDNNNQATARTLALSPWSTHITTLAAPSVTESVTNWAAWSFKLAPASTERHRVALAWWGNALATAAGMLFAAAVTSALARRMLPRPTAMMVDGLRRNQALLLLALLAGPLATLAADFLPDGGLLFSNYAVVHLGSTAMLAGAAAWLTTGRPSFAAGTMDFKCCRRGVLLGLVAAILTLTFLGCTWGTTWLQLIPKPERLAAAAILIVPFLFVCPILIWGTQRLLGPTPATWTGASLRVLAWLTVTSTVWLSHLALVRTERPLLGIPTLLLAASGVVSLPLWLLRDRPGLGAARAMSHALAAACFLGWHLPFVNS